MTLCTRYILSTTLISIVGIAAAHAATDGTAADSVVSPLPADTTVCTGPAQSKFGQKLDKWTSSRLYQMTSIGVPLIVGGLIVKGEDTHFRNLRNDYLPEFRNRTDNYIQLVPAAVLLGLKTAGVKGRSSWGRMLVSDAFSAAIMGGVVKGLKHTTNVMRPDGADNHSFPSGHTATAFMTATMLTKEYGHKSPWIGIGAYTAASATGIMRVVNNKHWLSDVMTGAGIGILSTELGYFIADAIFKDKGINALPAQRQYDMMDKPSFVSLYVGVNIPLSKYDIDEQHEFRTSAGSTAGVEGAYFFTPYVGVGGRVTVTNTQIITDGNVAEDHTFDAVSGYAGAYFSLPLTPRWQIGTKALAGYVHYPRLRLKSMDIGTRDSATFGTGVSATYRATDHYNARFFVDYNLLPSHSRGSREWMSTLAAGLSFAVAI